jgi:hypothetical protein
MHDFDECKTLLTGVIRKLHMVYNQGLLRTSYAKQHLEGFLQGHFSKPHVVPKPDPRPVYHLKSHKSGEIAPPSPNVFPYPHPVGPMHRIGVPPTPQALAFSFHHHSSQCLPFYGAN